MSPKLLIYKTLQLMRRCDTSSTSNAIPLSPVRGERNWCSRQFRLAPRVFKHCVIF